MFYSLEITIGIFIIVLMKRLEAGENEDGVQDS